MTFVRIILYARVSDASQIDGTGIDGQLADLRAFVSRDPDFAGVPVKVVKDEGRSAAKGHHRTRGDFGKFEAEVAAGEHHGALFLCEKVDRLSRQGMRTGTEIVQGLTDNGVSVRTLDGDSFNAGEDVGLVQDIMARLKFDQARLYAKNAAERTERNHRIRRAKAAETGKAMSAVVCPPWLTVDASGAYALDPVKVAILDHLFDLADQGQGASRIERIMNKLGKPANWSNRKRKDKSKFWQRSEIISLLSNRALIGEHQAKKRIGTKLVAIGDPLPGFYPVAIDPAKFARVAAAAQVRKDLKGGGSSKKVINLITGLVKCDECGGKAHLKSGYLYCTAGAAGAAQVCTNTVGVPYVGRYKTGLETALLDAVLHLALDDQVFSNRDEVVRLNTTIAERERALELATSKAEALWLRAVGEDASPMAERLARSTEAEANQITTNLTALREQREAARGRVSNQEHLRRVADIRQQMDQVPVRLKVAQALRSLITFITIDAERVATVVMAGGMAALKIQGGQIIDQTNALRLFRDGNYAALVTRDQADRDGIADVAKRMTRTLTDNGAYGFAGAGSEDYNLLRLKQA